MLDLLLINSPLYLNGCNPNEDYLPPMGLAYIASYSSIRGKEVSILDAVKLGLSLEEIIHKIKIENPTFLGINIFSTNYDIVQRICESINEETTILIGGNATAFCYKDISRWETQSKIYIVIGEGERIVYDIINDNLLQSPIYTYNKSNVYLVGKESKYFNENIDLLHLNRSYIDNSYKNIYNEIESSIVTSRGCPFNCAYCGSARSINLNTTVRRRSIENIKQEIIDIKKRSNEVTCIRVLDDLFLLNQHSIMDAINIFKMHPGLYWRSMAHVHILGKNSHLFGDLYNSGCKELFIGIESGSKRIRHFIHKKGEIHDIIDVVQGLLSVKIQVKAYFIIGFPTEDETDLEETYKLAKLLFDYSKKVNTRFRVSTFKFRPYHGTELFSYIREQHNDIKIVHENQSYGKDNFNFTAGNFSNVSDEKIEEYMRKMDTLKGD